MGIVEAQEGARKALENLAEHRTIENTRALQAVADGNRLLSDAMAIIRRIHFCQTIDGKRVETPLTPKDRERLQNDLIFFGLVNYAMSSDCTDEEITIYINRAIEQGKVTRPSGSEGVEKYAAALCALELEELELATIDSMVKIRLSR